MSNFVKPGLGSVGQYQMAGRPHARTVSVAADSGGHGQKISFPTVTRNITIKAHSGSNIIVHFTTDAAAARTDGEYFELAAGESVTLGVRVRDLYISKIATGAGATASVSICAELTNIDEVISYES
jgi:phosphotransferase system IIA component